MQHYYTNDELRETEQQILMEEQLNSYLSFCAYVPGCPQVFHPELRAAVQAGDREAFNDLFTRALLLVCCHALENGGPKDIFLPILKTALRRVGTAESEEVKK
jgi:hypothetical protein